MHHRRRCARNTLDWLIETALQPLARAQRNRDCTSLIINQRHETIFERIADCRVESLSSEPQEEKRLADSQWTNDFDEPLVKKAIEAKVPARNLPCNYAWLVPENIENFSFHTL